MQEEKHFKSSSRNTPSKESYQQLDKVPKPPTIALQSPCEKEKMVKLKLENQVSQANHSLSHLGIKGISCLIETID